MIKSATKNYNTTLKDPQQRNLNYHQAIKINMSI